MIISTVITAVAIPTPLEPKSVSAKDVAKDDEKVFTKLLPTKISVKRLSVFCFSFATGKAFFLFSFSIWRSFTFDKLKNAVSLQEKNADIPIRRIKSARENARFID